MQDMKTADHWRLIIRSLAVWIMLIVAEIIHGILRAMALVPVVGEFRSNQIGVLTGSAIILVIACLTIRWIGANRLPELLMVGASWLVLTFGFEMIFGKFVVGMTWERLLADYNIVQGGLMPLGLLLLFFSPIIATKILGK